MKGNLLIYILFKQKVSKKCPANKPDRSSIFVVWEVRITLYSILILNDISWEYSELEKLQK